VNTREYIEFLAEENETNEAGNDVAARFEAAGGAVPLVLAEQELAIPIVPAAGEESSSGAPMETTGSTTDDATAGSSSSVPTTTDPQATTAVATDTLDEDPGPRHDDGCGCRYDGAPGGAWPLVLLLAAPRRRREARR
jgi:MYXO-CTERM domain-containing protein